MHNGYFHNFFTIECYASVFEKTKDKWMKDIVKLAFTVLLGISEFSVVASANSKKGYNVFLQKLQESCSKSGINSGLKFTFKHTQDEWETIKQAGKFGEEIVRLCPKLTGKLKLTYDNELYELYEFSYEYASDSGNIPNF